MKYKVGDKVKVRKDLEEHSFYSDALFVGKPMKDMKGKIVTISEIRNKQYIIKEVCDPFNSFGEDMFEHVLKNWKKRLSN